MACIVCVDNENITSSKLVSITDLTPSRHQAPLSQYPTAICSCVDIESYNSYNKVPPLQSEIVVTCSSNKSFHSLELLVENVKHVEMFTSSRGYITTLYPELLADDSFSQSADDAAPVEVSTMASLSIQCNHLSSNSNNIKLRISKHDPKTPFALFHVHVFLESFSPVNSQSLNFALNQQSMLPNHPQVDSKNAKLFGNFMAEMQKLQRIEGDVASPMQYPNSFAHNPAPPSMNPHVPSGIAIDELRLKNMLNESMKQFEDRMSVFIAAKFDILMNEIKSMNLSAANHNTSVDAETQRSCDCRDAQTQTVDVNKSSEDNVISPSITEVDKKRPERTRSHSSSL